MQSPRLRATQAAIRIYSAYVNAAARGAGTLRIRLLFPGLRRLVDLDCRTAGRRSEHLTTGQLITSICRPTNYELLR